MGLLSLSLYKHAADYFNVVQATYGYVWSTILNKHKLPTAPEYPVYFSTLAHIFLNFLKAGYLSSSLDSPLSKSLLAKSLAASFHEYSSPSTHFCIAVAPTLTASPKISFAHFGSIFSGLISPLTAPSTPAPAAPSLPMETTHVNQHHNNNI